MADNNEQRDHISAYLSDGNSDATIGRDMSRASGGGAAVNIRFGDDDGPRKRIRTMDDLYLELNRQLQATNERMSEMRLIIGRLELETAQLKELRASFARLEEQFEILKDELFAYRGGNGMVIAKATLVSVVILALCAAYGVWVLSNGF